jgi:hypothetical protein
MFQKNRKGGPLPKKTNKFFEDKNFFFNVL